MKWEQIAEKGHLKSMAKLTNDAESTADGYDRAGVYLTDVLARVAFL